MSSEEFRIRLLVVDDEQSIRKLCMTVGESLGFVCFEAESGEAALTLLEEQPAHMVLTDMVMPRMSGLEFLEQVKRLLPRAEVALMTGHGSIETAVQAMKLGAYDYISKPFAPLDELRLFLRRLAPPFRHFRVISTDQYFRHGPSAEFRGSRVMRIVEQDLVARTCWCLRCEILAAFSRHNMLHLSQLGVTPSERFVLRRGLIAQRPRQQACDRINH